MPRSNVIVAAVAGLYFLYIAARGELAQYLSVVGL